MVLIPRDDLGVHLSECLLPLGRVRKKTGRSEANQKKAGAEAKTKGKHTGRKKWVL